MAMQIDLKRRGFLFGAAATTLIVAAPKSFFIIEPPKLVIVTPDKPFDLPLQQMLALMKKLDEQAIEMSAIPRWVVCNQDWYDQVVREEARRGPRLPPLPQQPDNLNTFFRSKEFPA